MTYHYFWSSFPTRWIQHDGGLKRFTATELGRSVTALKLYLAIAMKLPHRPSSYPPQVSLTYDELRSLTGASRALIGPGLGTLGSLLEIRRGTGTRPSRYSLAGHAPPSEGGWGKLPTEYLERNRILLAFNPRRYLDLNALKLYLLVLAFRNVRTNRTFISYEKITHHAGIPRARIFAAISQLNHFRALDVMRGREAAGLRPEELHSHNVYAIRGLSGTEE